MRGGKMRERKIREEQGREKREEKRT